MTTKTLAEQLQAIKPQVKAIPKVQVRRKKSWRKDSFEYEVEFVMEEMARGNTTVDKWMILDAINAFEGGAR